MRLTIFAKLILSFLMIISLLAVVSLIALTDNRRIVYAFMKGEEHYTEIVTAATEASSYAKRAEGHMFIYLSLHDKIDRKNFFLRCDSLQRQLQILDKHIFDPGARTKLERIRLIAAEILPTGTLMIDAYDRDVARTGRFNIERHAELIRKLFAATSKVRQLSVELVGTEVALEDEGKQFAVKEAENLRTKLIWLGLLSSIVVLVFSYFISRSISRPIIKLKTMAGEIGVGNFGVRMDIRSKDEIGILASSLNHMVEQLQQSDQQVRAANVRLRESEEKYRTLVNNLSEGVSVVDQDEKFVFANPAAEAIFGVPSGGLVGRSIQQFMDATEFGRVREQTARRRRGETASYEIQINRFDGMKRTLLTTASPFIDKDGAFIGAYGIFRDVTDQKMVVAQMAILRKAIDTSGEAIFLTDKKGIFTFINPGFVAMYGYTADEVVAKVTPRILKSGSIGADFYEMFWNTLLSGQEVRGELRNKRKDGSFIDIDGSANAIFDEDKNIIGFLGIQSDITQRKLTHEKLRKSEERFKQVAESAGEWIWETDAHGLYTYSSSAVQTILGYYPEEIVGRKHFYDLFTPDVQDELRQAALAAFARKEVIRGLINPNVHKNGTTVILETSGIPVLDQSGNLLGYRGADSDITARKRAEDTLKQSVSLLQATLESTADGILVVDKSGKITSYNRQFADMWSIPNDVISSRDDDRALDHVLGQLKDPEAFITKVRDLYAHPDESSFDVLEFKDHKIFERYSLPQRIEGKSVGRVWSFRDVTAREKTEREIKLLAQTIASTKDCVSITDLEDKIIFVNEAFLQTYGYTREELLGQPVSIVRSARNAPEVARTILPATLAGGWYGELLNRRKDGTEFPIELWTAIVKSDTGKVVATVGVAREITERKQMEMKLQQTIKERESLIQELQFAVDNVKTLEGLLPICSSCKKIRDDKGFWSQVEGYIMKHTGATFTHGICPECAKELYGDYLKK